MIDSVISRYVKELRNKIELKMIPNKTEDQILYQQFKFYDLDSSGLCNLQNFIRTNDRLGVVLPNIKEFEIVFNYFADQETSLLNYKQFIQEIFNFKPTGKKLNNYLDGDNDGNDFLILLVDKLIEKGGAFPLVELVKNLQMADFEGNKRLTLDEFIKVLQRCKVFLTSSEIQNLYQGYEFFINGVIKYQILINLLLEQFWDDKKLSFAEEINYYLTGNGRRKVTLNSLKKYFEEILEDSVEKKFFLKFIDEYKIINKINTTQSMNFSDILKFLKFLSFGQKSNNFVEDLATILKPEEKEIYPQIQEHPPLKRNNTFNERQRLIEIENKKNIHSPPKKINNFLAGYENSKLNIACANLRESLIQLGRKTLFNFIKHFKYYANDTQVITKCNFAKVLKDYNIKLLENDIENLFHTYTAQNNFIMNYEEFLTDLVLSYTTQHREDVIDYIYNTIQERAEEFQRDMDLSFLKDVYNAKNNYFKKEENENRIEFDECLEIYHFFYKSNKSEKVTKKEFIEFYRFISFLIPFEEDFINLICNEWRVPIEYVKNIRKEKGNDNNIPLYPKKSSSKNIIRHISNASLLAQLGEGTNEYQENGTGHKGHHHGDLDEITKDYLKRKEKPLDRKDFGLDNSIKCAPCCPKTKNEDSERPNYQKSSKLIDKLINNDFDNIENSPEKSLSLLTRILFNRGLRGILYLYVQFLSSCQNINKITYEDFIDVLQTQHINLSDTDYKNIFTKFVNNDSNYLDIYSFIRNFKKELNDSKLESVEKAFNIVDVNGAEKVPLNLVKKKYNAKNHPEVLSGKKTEQEKIMEFLDCFNICYELLNLDNKTQTGGDKQGEVDFDTFANFYEYVSFIYPDDEEFENVVKSTWF